MVIKCHAGCSTETVVSTLGLQMIDLFPAKDARKSQAATTGDAYDYQDENGKLLYQVVRFRDKKFRQRQPKPGGGWDWNLTGVRRVPYRLPELIAGVKEGKRIFIAEGEKDVKALVAAGEVATCNSGGAGQWLDEFADFFVGAEVIVVADDDRPGRKHAFKVGCSLTSKAESVRLVQSRTGKDAADHLAAGHGPDAFVPCETDETGVEYDCPTDTKGQRTAEDDDSDEPKSKSKAQLLVDLAEAEFEFARNVNGIPFAVPRNGPRIACQMGRSFRTKLAKIYRDRSGRPPSNGALSDALIVLEGEALESDATPIVLRCGTWEDKVVIDLGTADGRVVVVGADYWEILETSPLPLWRTAMTKPMVEPSRCGDLGPLKRLLNVCDADWPVLIAWCLAVWRPHIPCPALRLTGTQGAGKSTVAGGLQELVDPSNAGTQSPPKDLEAWAVSAAASRLVALDNLSAVPAWFSDALCRAVTGGALVRRQLYTDDGLSILNIMRAIILTGIDLGNVKGDFADRLVAVQLDGISDDQRKPKAELDKSIQAALPLAFGGLLDLLAVVLDQMPKLSLSELPRMADFALLLATVDQVLGTDGLARFTGMHDGLADEVISSDPVAVAITKFVGSSDSEWRGTATELLGKLRREDDEDGRLLPKTPNQLSGALTRLTPALQRLGVAVTMRRTGPARFIILDTVGPPDHRDDLDDPMTQDAQQGVMSEEAGHGEISSLNDADDDEISLLLDERAS